MKKNLIIFLILLMGIPSLANEFFVYYGGAFSGGLFGVGYTYFFTPNWGIGSGAEKAFYNSNNKHKEHILPSYTITDEDSNEVEIRRTAKGYKEEKNFVFLQIPLMLQYQQQYGEYHKFYAKAGTKICIPLSGKNKISADSLKISGYRKFEDYEYTIQTFKGFGTFENEQIKTEKLSLQTEVLLSAETGIKWKLNEALWLYSGIYFDYMLDSDTPPALGLKLNLAYPFKESKILK